MKLVGRVPVEPLSEERLTNIERAIVTGAADAAVRNRRESRMPAFAFAMATIVLVAGAGFLGWKLRGSGEAASVAAEVEPMTIKTDGPSTLDIGDAKITTDPATQFTVTRPGTGVRITMTRGKVGLEVGKRGQRDPLIVAAGDTEVIVIGTAFTVDYDGANDVDVRVTEGVVKVVRARKEARVAAGEAWQTTLGKLALADAKPRAATQVATAAGHGRESSADNKTPDDIVIPMPGKDIGLHERTAKVPEARIPTTGTIQPSGGSGERNFGTPENVRPTAPAITPHAQLHQDALIQLRGMPVLPAVNTGAVDATRAISILREASLKTGPEASAAFYSIAVLQHLKLGRDGDAIGTLENYIRRFRGGNEYKAALWLRVRIKCLKAIDDHCRQAAFTYAHEDSGTEAGRLAGRLSTMTSE